uniref:Transmembrane protein 216 n=1 Tax=Florenciella parvula TaxID=236787 RepID=A0A7S2BGR7_9STRA|mmetsp:Transcript_16370/g.34181  ORF Transcript_16370/g.34181 Transcript_16370/m.34181 type:complete len:148 (+) Transcript_16370:129-572(+)|eukprot:CAMPEP_0119465490 /NCGR_PEP_ID=MMETSP1344-20130328/596_1 /TAXON_ID=236787 /ORGANISM="Florenciella parvula, Strain CCMP2471" /LENGTH=147 /DNA_ID=CAMNT_0007497757 /DNA_START=180 /DNA_END=623 /DNA_ORIENTATION=+
MSNMESHFDKPMRSNLPLQILIYFNWWFNSAYLAVSVLLFTFKAYKFYYPRGMLIWEAIMLVLYLVVEISRLSQLTRGNKLETIDPMAKAFVLGLITILSYAYFLRLQTYVLYVEVVLNSIGICFVGSEVIFGLFASYQFLVDQQGY